MAEPVFLTSDEITANEEAIRIDGYRMIYQKTHPMPLRRKVNFMRELGLEAGLIAASSVAAVLLAGLRTYQAFTTMFNDSHLAGPLVVVGALCSIIAVEGLLMVTGLLQGKERGIKMSSLGTITAFVISIAAGLVVSFTPIASLIPGVTQATSITLAIATGIGASILAFVGGLISGSILYKWGLIEKSVDTELDTATVAWNQAMAADYHRRGARMYGTAVGKAEVQSVQSIELDTKVSERVQEWLNVHGISVFEVGVGAGHVATPQQIANDLNLVDSGSVRTCLSRLRKKAQEVQNDSNSEGNNQPQQ